MSNGNDEGLATLFLIIVYIISISLGIGVFVVINAMSAPIWISVMFGIIPPVSLWAYIKYT